MLIAYPFNSLYITKGFANSTAYTHKHISCIHTQHSCPHDMLYIVEMELPQFHPLTVPTKPREVNVTGVFQESVELDWLPPTEPNGEVHYVIYYTPEGGTEQSIDTGSDLTHYNLIGLERNRVYTDIAVQAVNILGRSNRSAVIALPGELSYGITAQKTCKHCTGKYKNIRLHIRERRVVYHSTACPI